MCLVLKARMRGMQSWRSSIHAESGNDEREELVAALTRIWRTDRLLYFPSQGAMVSLGARYLNWSFLPTNELTGSKGQAQEP
jgi:hypothetical protein